MSKFNTITGILSQLQSQLLSCEEIEHNLTKLLKKLILQFSKSVREKGNFAKNISIS